MEILKFENTISEKDLQITYLTKDLYLEYTKNSSHSTIGKQTAQWKTITKEDVWMTSEHRKRHSSVVNKGLQIKC